MSFPIVSVMIFAKQVLKSKPELDILQRYHLIHLPCRIRSADSVNIKMTRA